MLHILATHILLLRPMIYVDITLEILVDLLQIGDLSLVVVDGVALCYGLLSEFCIFQMDVLLNFLYI